MGKNYNGTQISQSVTVSEVAGATVEDCRNKIFVYDENGKAILATGGTKPFIGVALIDGFKSNTSNCFPFGCGNAIFFPSIHLLILSRI